ncbi:MAG: hypothetical protein AB1779_09585 [Candidatus Thermoplasmatota archaeon]
MAEMHHKVEREKVCEVKGCDKLGVRSLPMKKVSSALSCDFKVEGKRVELCKEHYKEFKKKTKKERLLDTLDWER